MPGLLVLLAIFGGAVPGLRPDRRAAGRRDRAVAGHPGQPGGAAARPLAARRRRRCSRRPPSSRCWRSSSACGCSIGDLLLAYLMLALIALMTSAVSYGVALAVKSEDALAPLMNTVAQPVLLLSGILLPLTFAPGLAAGRRQVEPVLLGGRRHAGRCSPATSATTGCGRACSSWRCSPCSRCGGRPGSSPAACADNTDDRPGARVGDARSGPVPCPSPAVMPTACEPRVRGARLRAGPGPRVLGVRRRCPLAAGVFPRPAGRAGCPMLGWSIAGRARVKSGPRAGPGRALRVAAAGRSAAPRARATYGELRYVRALDTSCKRSLRVA